MNQDNKPVLIDVGDVGKSIAEVVYTQSTNSGVQLNDQNSHFEEQLRRGNTLEITNPHSSLQVAEIESIQLTGYRKPHKPNKGLKLGTYTYRSKR